MHSLPLLDIAAPPEPPAPRRRLPDWLKRDMPAGNENAFTHSLLRELKLETVPVTQLLDEIVELARPQADASKIRVIVGHEVDGIGLRIDRDLLKQAMLNIVVNAMQAMPEGGELRFESLAGEDAAEIRISDTGAGIPPELRDKIFRRYFTTKKEGSGIGLAMTFRIVQLHDGTIDFTSEPGKGTTFSIRLPIAS